MVFNINIKPIRYVISEYIKQKLFACLLLHRSVERYLNTLYLYKRLMVEINSILFPTVLNLIYMLFRTRGFANIELARRLTT